MDLPSTSRCDAHVFSDSVEILSVKIVSHEYLALVGTQTIEYGFYFGTHIFAVKAGVGSIHISRNPV